MHRPRKDWTAARRRHDPTTVEARVFAGLRAMGTARREQLALRAGGETTPLPVADIRVLAYRRRHPRSGTLVALANFGDGPASVGADELTACGLRDGEVVADR